MAVDFKSYLATQVVSEKQTVSYRNVSRALKVHVNAAKCMLYEFWEKENKKKSGSIYATYLIAGVKKQEERAIIPNGKANHADEDVPMPSSPPPFPSFTTSHHDEHPDPSASVPVKTISLVREEDLETTKAQYENITSIHLYSLSPGRLEDLVVLTDIGRGIYVDYSAKEDPLKDNKTYGVIQNTGVRRRKGKRPIIPAASSVQPQPVKEEKKEAFKPTAAATKPEKAETSRPGSRDSSISASSIKQPSLKRDGSNLFKAFAKAQNKPKVKREDTDASTNASVSGTEDVKMIEADEEGESEDDAIFLDTGTKKTGSKKRQLNGSQGRENERAKLRKMMDSDDEAATDEKPATAKKGEDEAKAAKDEDEEVAWSESDTEQQKEKAKSKGPSAHDADEPVSTEPGRRRGKRKVMKKRTMKDEDGYLVTKEEAVWESFSEEEPEAAKEKPKNAFSSMKSQPASQKSTAGAKGGTQKKKGDIMSFFGKK